jgi:hypothetical protein
MDQVETKRMNMVYSASNRNEYQEYFLGDKGTANA